MSNSLQIEFPKADMDALFRSMNMAVRYLGYDAGHALKAAATHLVRSLSASTKISPKFRKITEVEGPTTRWAAQHHFQAFDVAGWFGRPRREGVKRVYSRDLPTARRRHATIGNRGLARKVWAAAGFGRGPSVSTSSRVSAMAKNYADTKSNLTGSDLFVEIINTLPYADQALAGGPKDVNTAMERAARGMEQSVERQLVRRMGLGSLSR